MANFRRRRAHFKNTSLARYILGPARRRARESLNDIFFNYIMVNTAVRAKFLYKRG